MRIRILHCRSLWPLQMCCLKSADLRVALVLQHAVEALRVEAAGVLIRRFAVAPLDF